jgi:hypothetical protein
MDHTLIDIDYQDGLAVFRLPEHWVAEIDADQRGQFYDPASTGTLRLEVLTFEAAATGGFDFTIEFEGQRVLERSARPDGGELIVTEEETSEDGSPLIVHRWHLGRRIGDEVFVHLFSYTYDPPRGAVADELALIDREIRRMSSPAQDEPR